MFENSDLLIVHIFKIDLQNKDFPKRCVMETIDSHGINSYGTQSFPSRKREDIGVIKCFTANYLGTN